MDIDYYYAQLFTTASALGSVAFALSGFMVGARKQLDVMGVFILAFLSANGGGVVRDLLVGDHAEHDALLAHGGDRLRYLGVTAPVQSNR